ncbi:unnamed protein product [Leptosia nina]|uniref:Uncharacterized protein n=1 Tax=Leptosia nina TaxID=320188 RepID=A0AAV1JHN6_9NEOP
MTQIRASNREIEMYLMLDADIWIITLLVASAWNYKDERPINTRETLESASDRVLATQEYVESTLKKEQELICTQGLVTDYHMFKSKDILGKGTKSSKIKFIVSSFTMNSVLVFIFLAIVCIIELTEANYKKLPFNGSIFGKRSSNDLDTSRALFALCEITTETCDAWMEQMYGNK